MAYSLPFNRLQNEFNALVNRSADRHLRLAVTGLSRSGKTAFITSLVNQLLNAQHGARLPLFSVARENRLLGARRIPQRDLGIPRFAYDEGMASLYGVPPAWPTRPAASAKSGWRCVTVPATAYCAISATPRRSIWKSSIIPASGCWICRCWSRVTPTGRGRCPPCCRATGWAGRSPGWRCARGWTRWRRRMRTGWRRSPRRTPTICCDANKKGCISFNRGVLCCRAIWPRAGVAVLSLAVA